MPTCTAITLDRLLEPESRNTVPKPPSAPVKVVRTVPSSSEKKSISRPVVSPALYATPETIPLPDSPSSFSPSPYIINHKRRGPRLIKSHSHNTVIGCQPHLDGEKVEVVNGREVKVAVDVLHDGNLKDEQDPNGYRPKPPSDASSNGGPEKIDGSEKPLTVDTGRDTECEDFFDPQDSMSSIIIQLQHKGDVFGWFWPATSSESSSDQPSACCWCTQGYKQSSKFECSVFKSEEENSKEKHALYVIPAGTFCCLAHYCYLWSQK